MESLVSVADRKITHPQKTIKFLTIGLYLVMFTYGISLTMLGPLMPIIIVQYDLKMSQGGLITALQSIGGIAAIALGAVLSDLVRKSRLVAISFVLYSLSLLFLATSQSYIVLLGLFFIVGASTKMLDAIISAFISDLHPDRRGHYMALLHTLLGVGALVGPMFSTVLLNLGVKWNNTFLILGIICLVILFIYILAIKKNPDRERQNAMVKSGNNLRLLFKPKILVLGLIVFTYCGHQFGTSAWMPMYMEKVLSSNTFLAGFSVSGFWVGIILGRLTSALISTKVNIKYMILYGSLLGGFILTLGIVMSVPLILIISLALAGFLTGAIFPLSLTVGCNTYPQNTGAVSSILVLYNTLAYMVFPWAIGIIAENVSFKFGILITGFALLVTSMLALLLPVQRKDS